MAISTAFCSSFKQGLMQGLHNFTTSTGNTFKIALFTSSATQGGQNLGAATTSYTGATGEVASGGGYTTGGNTLTNITPTTSGTTAFTDFSDSTWSSATITANGALIYNSNASNASCVVLAFGSDKSSTNGDFTIVFPTADATSAIIRIS